MGAFASMKLCRLFLPAALLAVLFVHSASASSSPCPNHQYWHESREACVNCSTCKEPGNVVLRPCQVHQDAQCGPLRALNIDWSWMGRNYASSNSSSRSKHHHHHHKKNGHSSHWSSSSETSSSSSSGQRRYHKRWHHEKSFNSSKKHHLHHHHHHKKMRPPESAAQLKEADAAASHRTFSAPLPADPQRRQQQAPFSTAETLVWDWQAVVLVMAVLACVLFFVAAAAYGVLQTRKDAYRTADVEDLTATLSLMVLGNNGDNLDGSATVMEDSNTNQCLYMEQLLVRKQQDEPREGKGNVYIDRDNASSPRVK